MAASYSVGIDLGTTNCAVAFAALAAGADAAVVDFPIPQLQRPGQTSAQSLLPSCLYLAGAHELPPGSTQLPWDSPEITGSRDHKTTGQRDDKTAGQARSGRPVVPSSLSPVVAGEFARWQGARVPGRLVASAKSWLCHAGVDRSAPILPWGAPAEVAKLSPVEATARLLAHLASAWNHAHPAAPLAAQDVVITVPASFDEVARALTVRAARQAGLEKLTLVEEPQAAFYDFTSRHRHDLTTALAGVRLVLVVDVGGGTTDFTLIQVGLTSGGPSLQRIAVGDHLMLGGDNRDAALAREVEERLLSGGRKLGATQWTQLVQAARAAKEALLGAEPPARHGIALVSEGSRLLRGALSAEIDRVEAERLILEGFFPACAADEAPRRAARAALQELGLPYAQDAAVTRHLAAFLRQHAAAGSAALNAEPAERPPVSAAPLPRPDAILLNGGVFNSPRIAGRLLDVVSAWWPESPRIRLLRHDSLELAVARGAACYGLVRRGLGQRIGGGAAHAFYVGLAADQTGGSPRAVCVIPRGHEEGRALDLTGRPFSLTLGQPVQFPLFSTTADRIDPPGGVVTLGEEFRPLPPIHTLLRAAHGKAGAIPVHLRATLTELGTLELWCVANESDERWRLEFELRGAAARTAATVTESMPAEYGEVRAVIGRVFGKTPLIIGPRDVKQLGSTLEAALGARETWRLPLLREMWGAFFAGAKNRRRSPAHERMFFRLVGYSLRPGFGYPLDEWRCEQTFRLFSEGVTARDETSVWNEFWVMWRRVAGGLTPEQQEAVWALLKPHLARRVPAQPAKNAARPKGAQPEGLDEMVRTAASLEHLPPVEKIALGNWIAGRLKSSATAGGPWAWSLGRLGARVPLYGSGHRTVDADCAAEWLAFLLETDWRVVDGAAFAVAQLARLTGDRTRDVDEGLRTRTVDALRAAGAPARWWEMVHAVVVLEADDEARALGDTLPIGLKFR